jgi:hypothetical protein
MRRKTANAVFRFNLQPLMPSSPITYHADVVAGDGNVAAPARKMPHLPLLIAGIAFVLFCSAAIARSMEWLPVPAGDSGIHADSGELAAGAMDVPVSAPGHSRHRLKCPGCGSVVSSREIGAGAGAAGTYGVKGGITGVTPLQAKKYYAFTVRLSDGSSRVVVDSNPAAWRIGERVNVIDGAKPSKG